jgi:hypothetical protein
MGPGGQQRADGSADPTAVAWMEMEGAVSIQLMRAGGVSVKIVVAKEFGALRHREWNSRAT